MNAAIWLDPRYCHKIVDDPEKCRKAKLTLCNVWEKIKFNRTNDARQNLAEQPIAAPVSNSNLTLKTLFSRLDVEFNLQGVPSVEIIMEPVEQCEPSFNKTKAELLLDMNKFNPPRMRPEESIWKFWQKTKNEFNHFQELSAVAFVIMAICPSEVQTERDMSKLAFIFNEMRSTLDENLLEQILLTNLNKDLFLEVKEKMIAEIA